MRKVIAIDFDGTLCENAWPEIGAPKRDVINRALAEQAAGAALILWTCREGDLLDEAVFACRTWGLYFDAVNENLPERIEEYGNDCRKIGADEYWDDRAVPLPQVAEINLYDKEEIHHNCTVQVWTNTATGQTSIGWWPEGEAPEGMREEE